MKFQALSCEHLEQLFQFELENRIWFESLIASRGEDFYSRSNIKQHIFDCMASAKQGHSYSGVLIANNAIVARGNLKNICAKKHSGSVGYRVAKNCIGKGFASFCLSKLIKVASNDLALSKLNAQVLDNNPASAAVLIKRGFKAKSYQPNYFTVNGEKFGCTNYEFIYELQEPNKK